MPRSADRRSVRRSVRLLLVLPLVAVVALSGCADDSDDSGGGGGEKVDVADSDFDDRSGADEVEVDVKDNTFTPTYVVVSPGTKVIWTNNGRNDHNVVPVEDDSFEGVDRDDFGPGKVHTATFDDAGDYPYYCSIHGTKSLAGQAGVIRVTDEGSAGGDTGSGT